MSATAAPPAAGLPSGRAVLDQAGAENFPVASRLLPRAQRADLMAIYGFARLVDDAGDEAGGDRLALLDWLDADVERLYAGAAEHPQVRALESTVRAHAIPPDPLRALIQANRQDQAVEEYATHDELLGYCALSANPVGRLVLHVFDAATPERIALSDAICSGLQLVEHWQDVAEDLGKGRVYLPAEDRERFGCTREDLAAPAASPAFRALMAFEVGRARDLLDRGAPLVATLRGRPRFAIAAFLAGGRSALDAIARAGFDVLGARPRPTRLERVRALGAALVEARAR